MWRRKVPQDNQVDVVPRHDPPSSNHVTFPQINELHDDIVISILEFVADAPHERPHEVGDCDLTKSLPFVSKKFKSFTDHLWKYTLERLVLGSEKPGGRNWMQYMQLFLDHESCLETDVHSLENKTYSKRMRTHSIEDMKDNETSGSYLIRKALQIALRKRQQFQNDNDTHVTNPNQWLYCHLLHGYVRYQSPLFFMPDDVHLGYSFGLHFFEPRYRQLISSVMVSHNCSLVHGEVITAEQCGGNLPTFIYAHNSPLKPGSIACIVQVRQCTIYPNGTADVLLLPISYARIEKVATIDHATKLYGAIVHRLSMHESQEIEFPSSADSPSRQLRGYNERNTDDMNNAIQAMLRHLASQTQNQGDGEEGS